MMAKEVKWTTSTWNITCTALFTSINDTDDVQGLSASELLIQNSSNYVSHDLNSVDEDY